MSIPKACIEAAQIKPPIPNIPATDWPEARARRVILALVENMPPDAVEEAARAHFDANGGSNYNMRAAIAAFLNHAAGDQP